MEDRDFFNIVLNHFLVVSKIDDNYSISSLKLQDKGFGLEFNSKEKIILDNLNSVSSPLITGLKDRGDIFVLPPANNWKSLSLKVGNELGSLYTPLRDLIKTEVPVILLDDLKKAISSKNLQIPVRLCEIDLSAGDRVKTLKDMLLRKLTVYDKRQFCDDLTKYFLVVSSIKGKINFLSVEFDEDFKPKFNKEDMAVLKPINDLGLFEKFSTQVSSVFVMPPAENWKTLTIERSERKSSLFFAINSLLNFGLPVIRYEDLTYAVKHDTYKIPVSFCEIPRYSRDDENVKNLISFMGKKFDVEISKFTQRREVSKTLSENGLELEQTNYHTPNYSSGTHIPRNSNSSIKKSEKKKGFLSRIFGK